MTSLGDLLTGRKRPPPGTPARSADAVRAALLALDRDTAPYTVRAARPEERCDLLAEWKIVDARWYGFFAKNRLAKSFTVYMRLDPAAREVRSRDRMASLEWSVGVPATYVESSVTWGRELWEKSYGRGWALTEELRPGEVYNYRFDTWEIKGPLQAAVASMGWTWHAIGLGRL